MQLYTSQMIHHCGVSLSKQHTYFVTAYKAHITAGLSLSAVIHKHDETTNQIKLNTKLLVLAIQ